MEQCIQDAQGVDAETISAIKVYSLEGYKDINNYLDGKELSNHFPKYEETIQSQVDLITKEVNKHTLKEDAQLYRGQKLAEIFGEDAKYLSLEELQQKYTGKFYVKRGFTSTATSLETARKFAAGSEGCILSIHGTKGASVMCIGKISCYEDFEEEVLVQRGSIFRIDKIEKEQEKIHITVTLVGRRRLYD